MRGELVRKPIEYGRSANLHSAFKGILDTLDIFQRGESDTVKGYKDVMAQLGVLLNDLFYFVAQLCNRSGASVVTFVLTLFG